MRIRQAGTRQAHVGHNGGSKAREEYATLPATEEGQPDYGAGTVPLPPPDIVPKTPNTAMTLADCLCPRPCIRLKAPRDIAEEEKITITRDTVPTYGGTTHPARNDTAAGAGVVVFAVGNNAYTNEDARYVVPLPGLLNSAQAQAVGSVVSLTKAYGVLRQEPTARISIQGDNAGIVGYWTGDNRVKD